MPATLFPTDRTELNAAGNLVFDGADLTRLATERETPFFLISENILRANYRQFTEAFAGVPGFRVFFSVKTNYESGVLRTLRSLGSGTEVSGALDLLASCRAGFSPRDIVFDGPSKTEEELSAAIDLGVHLINIECEPELRTIDRMARERRRVVQIGVRIDPIIKNPYYGQLISTYKSKFGFRADESERIFELARSCPNVQVVALHAHIGSQILSPDLYVKNLEVLVQLAARQRQKGIEIREINMGGGFPAQSTRHLRVSRRVKGSRVLERLNLLETTPPTIGDFGQRIRQGFEAACRRFGVNSALTAEPGRSLVSNTCVLVGKVRHTKDSWIFSDISINDVPENLFFSEFRMLFPNRMRDGEIHKAHLSGPTLATNDVVAYEAKVPRLAPGDPIAIFDTGAYSISRATQFTRPRNAVYFLRSDGQLEVIRRRERCEDVMRMQVWGEGEEAGEADELSSLVSAASARVEVK